MSYRPPCNDFDILSLFPPTSMGGLCFEEDGEPDGEANEPDEQPEGNQDKGLQAAKAAETKKRQAAEQRAAELEQRLAEIEAAQKKRDEEAAAKRGEFEKLYTDLKAETDPLREQLTAYQQREQARTEALNKANAEALEALPEDLRGLVPDGLDPEAKAAQIRKVAAMIGEAPSGGFAPRVRQKAESDAIPAEYREQVAREAQRYGMDPKLYYKLRVKPKIDRQKSQ